MVEGDLPRGDSGLRNGEARWDAKAIEVGPLEGLAGFDC
jgi:hypothetical protein